MAKREIVVELQLSDKNAVAELGRLEIETKQYQRELKALNAEIAKNGQATRQQQEAVGTLNASIRRNQTVIRELKNDLSGATDAGLRFRDKMAEASRAGLAEFGLQAVGIAGVTTAVIALTKELFTLSGELEKADARNRAIAGDSLPAFEAAAQRTANAIGLTEREYVSLASDQALRLKQLGIEGDLMESLAIQTVEFAEKLGDFSAGELSTEQAARLLNDALTGQTRGLKELGINVKASKDEIDAVAESLMESEGLTKDQATAVATLQLAFDATRETMEAFTDETIALDAAQDAANAKFKEAKESLAEALAPAFIGATEAGAGFLKILEGIAEGITRGFDSDRGFAERFDGFVDALSKIPPTAGGIGLVGRGLGFIRDLFGGDLKENAEATAKAIEDLSEALPKGSVDPFEVVGTRTRTIKELRDELKNLKEAREGLKTTDTEALAANSASIVALEKQIAALDASTKATTKKSEAVRKLTADQLAQLDAEDNVRSDALGNIFAQTGDGTTTPAVELQKEEEAELDSVVEQGLANRNALREEARLREISGIVDLNAERSLLEAEWQSGSIASYEEYAARKAAIDTAMKYQQMQALGATADIFGSLASLYDEASEEHKAFATIQTLINTYMSATQAYNALVGIPYVGPYLATVAAAAAVAAGLANVAKIQGFEEGGYTSKRRRDDEPVGVVHANEYVVPAPIVRNPRGKRLIDELERMRMGHPVRYAPPFIGGGIGTNNNVRFARGTGLAQTGITAADVATADLSRAIMSMPAPVVRVDEINRVQRRVNVIESISRT